MDTATIPAQPVSGPHEASAPACEPVDPRIRRTRELLQHSLGQLLETKDFDRISVHEITDAAGVNRATFYAHYTDKFALLECMVATRFLALLDERGIIIQGGCTNALRGLVVGLCDFLTRSTCHHDPEPSRTLQPHMETALVAVLRNMVLEGLTQHEAASNGTGPSLSVETGIEQGAASLGPQPQISPDATMRAAAIAWAIYGATRESLTPANHPPADEIAEAVITLIAPLFLSAT